MTKEQILEIFSNALFVVLKLAAPMLLTSILIGLIVAIFQAATQIHEQTLTFVPKLVFIALMLLFSGSWMMTTMVDFFNYLIGIILSI